MPAGSHALVSAGLWHCAKDKELKVGELASSTLSSMLKVGFGLPLFQALALFLKSVSCVLADRKLEVGELAASTISGMLKVGLGAMWSILTAN